MNDQKVEDPRSLIFYELIKSLEFETVSVQFNDTSGLGAYYILAKGSRTPFICFKFPKEERFSCVFATLLCPDDNLSKEIYQLAEKIDIENQIKSMRSARLESGKFHERET